MLKSAIVGCGKMSEAHAAVIHSIPEAELVATCDSEILMAKQLAERFGAKQYFKDLGSLIKNAKPDVVHIITPPQSHYEIAKACLESGINIFVEKPFSVSLAEAEAMLALAEIKNLKVTVGTDEQFSIVMQKARNLVKQGWIGGSPVHLEVYYCYDMSDERYIRSFLKNRSHWIWNLPGQMIQNIIPHAIMKIAEYIDEDFNIISSGFTSNYFRRLGENQLIDEIRALIIDRNNTTAFLSFSTQMKPAMIQFRIFGPENGIAIDEVQQSLIMLYGKKYKSYLERFIPLYKYSKQYRKNFYTNIKLFMKREFHIKRSLYNLVSAFYKSIYENGQPPISYKDILKCSKMTDLLMSQIYSKK